MTGGSLAIIGHGRMGRAVEELALDAGWQVVAVLDADWDRAAAAEILSNASVAVEFTEPDEAPGNILACIGAGCPVVVGTTGWYRQLDVVSTAVTSGGGRLLWAPNFSIGAQMLQALGRAAGEMAARSGTFDAHLIETHHTAKKDKPSGTALAIGEVTAAAFGREIPVTSIRTGSEPGTHELVFDAQFEQLRLTHRVRDRRVFAAGALRAAEFLRTRRHSGVYTIQDMLSDTGEENR
jgi:4-hydroxy-tetrahydrodipicolinate reductase